MLLRPLAVLALALAAGPAAAQTANWRPVPGSRAPAYYDANIRQAPDGTRVVRYAVSYDNAYEVGAVQIDCHRQLWRVAADTVHVTTGAGDSTIVNAPDSAWSPVDSSQNNALLEKVACGVPD